jgi:hypothetical protein
MPLRSNEIRPSAEAMHKALHMVVDDDEDKDVAWGQVCRNTGLPESVARLSDYEAEKLLGEIARLGTLPKVMSMSWQIRFNVAQKLEQLGR